MFQGNGRVLIDNTTKNTGTRPIMQSRQDAEFRTECNAFDQRTWRGDTQLESTPLSQLFFSQLNVEAIQQGIQAGVYYRSQGKYKIGKQSEEQLLIIMRAVFLQNAAHRPGQVVAEVRELNEIVLREVIPQVYSAKEQYEGYRRDQGTLYMPMTRSLNMSSAGTRVLETRNM